MDSKYYIPSIEEFHIGFEYELLQGHENPKWNKLILGFEDTFYHTHFKFPVHIRAFIEMEKCRVKYLNKEDIESLGFKHILGRYFMNCIINDEKEEIYLEESYPAGSHSICICNGLSFEDEISWFRGIIKNKSELKTIMKQIGIL